MSTLTTREMVALYAAGNSPATIAKQCTLGHAGIRNRLRKEGVVFRKKGHNRLETDYLAGFNLRAIAKKYSISHETVRQRLKARGVSLRDTKGREKTTIPNKEHVVQVQIPRQHVTMFNTLFTVFGAKQL